MCGKEVGEEDKFYAHRLLFNTRVDWDVPYQLYCEECGAKMAEVVNQVRENASWAYKAANKKLKEKQ
jgi:hypothetical protein